MAFRFFSASALAFTSKLLQLHVEHCASFENTIPFQSTRNKFDIVREDGRDPHGLVFNALGNCCKDAGACRVGFRLHGLHVPLNNAVAKGLTLET